jgi:hypothetical protein
MRQIGSFFWTAASNSVTTLVSSGLNKPVDAAVDGAGDVYIADYGHNSIKEWIAASNSITTLVSSGLFEPAGVTVDNAGNVYIADSGNGAIKEWTPANQTVTTLASLGVLSFPRGMAVDGAGNVYFADESNNTINELPHAFVDPTAKLEGPAAGCDVLPVVLPSTANLTGPFLPTTVNITEPFLPFSDSDWLTVTGSTNGVVSFAFTANTSATNRVSYIILLGQQIQVTQAASPTFTEVTMSGDGEFQFTFSDTVPDATFTVLSSTNLSLPMSDWDVAGIPTSIAPGLFQFTAPANTNDLQRFYRVSSP